MARFLGWTTLAGSTSSSPATGWCCGARNARTGCAALHRIIRTRARPAGRHVSATAAARSIFISQRPLSSDQYCAARPAAVTASTGPARLAALGIAASNSTQTRSRPRLGRASTLRRPAASPPLAPFDQIAALRQQNGLIARHAVRPASPCGRKSSSGPSQSRAIKTIKPCRIGAADHHPPALLQRLVHQAASVTVCLAPSDSGQSDRTERAAPAQLLEQVADQPVQRHHAPPRRPFGRKRGVRLHAAPCRRCRGGTRACRACTKRCRNWRP